LLKAHPQRIEHPGRDSLALAHQAEQQMLGTDIVVAEAPCLIDRQFYDLLCPRRKSDFAYRGPIAASDDKLNRAADAIEFDSEIREHLGRDTLTFAHQAEQQMLG